MKQMNSLNDLMVDISAVETLQQALSLYKRFGGQGASVSRRTRVEYEHDVGDLIAFLTNGGIHRVGQISLTHLKVYQANMESRGYKPSTLKRKTYAIKDFCAFLHMYALIKDDIGKRLIPPQVERGEPRFLSEAEYTRLLQVCQVNIRDAAIIELFLQTGIRLSELEGLTIRDVTLHNSPASSVGLMESIRIKRGSGHIAIPLNHKASNALRKWLEIREPTLDTALFLTAVKKPMGKRAIQLMLEKYLKEAAIEDASVQSLRHTMAVHHITKGTPIKTVAEILGDDTKTMEMYVTLARRVYGKALQENAL